jgi:hypothetical protein
MMSSSGAAVDPGAKADSTGVAVILGASLVADGSCNGTGVPVGGTMGAGVQASRMSRKDKFKEAAKSSLFM